MPPRRLPYTFPRPEGRRARPRLGASNVYAPEVFPAQSPTFGAKVLPLYHVLAIEAKVTNRLIPTAEARGLRRVPSVSGLEVERLR